MDPRAQGLKEQGNAAFSDGRNEEAVHLYTSAIDIEANAVLYSNRAAAYLKLNRLDEALEDAETAIRLDPTYVKAYVRKGNALMSQGKFEEARAAFKAGLEVEPSSVLLKQKLSELRAASATWPAPTGAMRAPTAFPEYETFDEMLEAFTLVWAEELNCLSGAPRDPFSGVADPRACRPPEGSSMALAMMAHKEGADDIKKRVQWLDKPVAAFWRGIAEHASLPKLTTEMLETSVALDILSEFLSTAYSRFAGLGSVVEKGSHTLSVAISTAFSKLPGDSERDAKLVSLLDCFANYLTQEPLSMPDPWGVRSELSPSKVSAMSPVLSAAVHGTPALVSLVASKGVPLNPRSTRPALLPLEAAYIAGREDNFARLLELGAEASMGLLSSLIWRFRRCTCLLSRPYGSCSECALCNGRSDADLKKARLVMLRKLFERKPSLLIETYADPGEMAEDALEMSFRQMDAGLVDMILQCGGRLYFGKRSTLAVALSSSCFAIVELLVNKYKLADSKRYSDAAIRELAYYFANTAVQSYAPNPAFTGLVNLMATEESNAERSRIVDLILGSGFKACWDPERQNALLKRLYCRSKQCALTEAHTIELLERFRKAGWNVTCWNEAETKPGSDGSQSLPVVAYSHRQPAVVEYAIETLGGKVDSFLTLSNGTKSSVLLLALQACDTTFARRLLSRYKARAAYPMAPATAQPLYLLLDNAEDLEDEEARKVIALMIENSPDLLEMPCYREQGVPGTRSATVPWTPLWSCVNPPKPKCLELLLSTVPAAKAMARQPVTTLKISGTFLQDTPLLLAVQLGSWECASLLLSYAKPSVTENLTHRGGVTLPSPLQALKEAAVGPNPPPRALIIAFEAAARGEYPAAPKHGGATASGAGAGSSLAVGEGATTNAFEDPSLGEGKTKRRNRKKKSGKKKSGRAKKTKKKTTGASGSGARAKSSHDGESSDDSSDEDDELDEEPDDNLVDSRFAPSLDLMLAEREKEERTKEDETGAKRK